jgi:cytochrome c biogenesis protein CcdA
MIPTYEIRVFMNNFWILVVFAGLSCIVASGAAASGPVCAWYFTGVGCTHCAQADPFVLGDWLETYPDLVIIEYEIYEQRGNAGVYDSFVEQHDLAYGIPLFFLSPDHVLRGNGNITGEGPRMLDAVLSGSDNDAGILPLASCPCSQLDGSPKIWCGDRILIRWGTGGDDMLLRKLLVTDDIGATLEGEAFSPCKTSAVQLSGSTVAFDHAVRLESWTFQWRGAGLNDTGSPTSHQAPPESTMSNTTASPSFTLPKIVALACVDAVNPCALAVLTLVLLSIMASSAGAHERVVWAGIAFSAAVFVMYLIYGIVIVSLFSLAAGVAGLRNEAGLVLGAFAILLGLAQLYDARNAGNGESVTGMPESFRSRVRVLVSSISSIPGAFLIGAFITVFLLPCTIGPYIIAGGVLSPMGLIAALPYLILYNAVFILPMLALTVAIGMGLGRPGTLTEWRKGNLRVIHAFSGLIMFVLGFGLVFGLF